MWHISILGELQWPSISLVALRLRSTNELRRAQASLCLSCYAQRPAKPLAQTDGADGCLLRRKKTLVFCLFIY